MLVPPKSLRGDEDFALCQDCGHVAEYSEAKHLNSELCSKCGGHYCGCTMCSGVARLSLQFQALAEVEKQADGENPAAFNGPEQPAWS